MSDETGDGETLLVDQHIVVSQSAFDLVQDEPERLVQDVVNFVNHMMQDGRYTRHEVCVDAVYVFHCDYYLAQVKNGGHAQFVSNTGSLLDVALADVLFGLDDIGAKEHLILARRMSQWVLDHEDQIDLQTSFEGAVSQPLADLDSPFYALENEKPLSAMLARWLAAHPALRIVADEDLSGVLNQMAIANPERPHREAIMSIARLQTMVSQNPEAQFSVVVGALATPEPLISVGGGSYMDVDGEKRLTFTLRTTSGLRWCVLTDEGAALHERIIHDNSNMPLDPEDATPEALQNWKSPELGEQLSFVSTKQVAACAAMAQRLNVGAAVHLILEQMPDPMKVDYITIRSAGPDQNGLMGLSLLLVLNNATLALSAIVTEDHGILLSEPDHQQLATVTAQDIADHAADYSPSQLH